jgi:hypothetical protein
MIDTLKRYFITDFTYFSSLLNKRQRFRQADTGSFCRVMRNNLWQKFDLEEICRNLRKIDMEN